jgi:hypothetical protein
VRILLGVVGIAYLLLSAQTPTPPAPPDPATLFTEVTGAMSRQQMPSQSSYDETLTPNGLDARIIESGGLGVFHLAFSSSKTPHMFSVTQQRGAMTQIVDQTSGQHYAASVPFWSTTWGAFPSTSGTPAPQTTVLERARTEAITDLMTSSEGSYTLSLVGVENLNGVAVYHLHLIAADPVAHPLTDVFADEGSLLVRRALANFKDASITSVTGTLTLNFGPVGSFWLITSGEADATVHAYFETVSGSATFAASNIVTSR